MKILVILVVSMSLFEQAYSDEIYRYRDKNGALKYSDKKPKAKHDVLDKGDYRGLKEPAKPQTETAAENKEEPQRDINEINAVTNTIKKDIDAIYNTIYQSDNQLTGTVIVSFSIQPQGTVTACREDESQMTRPAFSNRICKRIQQLNYGVIQRKTATKVEYTYTFTPAL